MMSRARQGRGPIPPSVGSAASAAVRERLASHIQAAFDSGDHLHPGDGGYKAMADSIDLRILTEKR